MTNEPHILVVEDNRNIRELVIRYLQEHGLMATPAMNGREMRAALEQFAIDLIVLDRMLPGVDGLTLCKEIRSRSTIPIIMLTAMAAHTDRVVGLEMGADDYLTKPFDPGELLARIRAVLRRSQGGAQSPPERFGHEAVIRFGDWALHMARRALVDRQGLIEPLSNGEFDLLLAFLYHPQKVLSRDQLLDLARGRTADNFDRSMDTQVMRLRRKIEADPKDPQIIKTVWGGGYMFTPEVHLQ
ncbi:MAG: response regulator [Magnetococcales bacterium]|nr:response regulator [Magnetococcales bacterium]